MRHGYAPGRVVVVIVALYAVCSAVFWFAGHHSGFVPREPGTTVTSRSCNSSEYLCFEPLAYAVDVVVPLVKLGQADAWHPDTNTVWGTVAFIVAAVGTLAGWALTTLAVVAFTGLVRRRSAA